VRCGHVRPGQASLQGLPELLREVTVLGVYRHPHLVPLLSFSLSRNNGQQEACLVYPLMARGGLDEALAARAARPLDAATRLRIAADAAAGLAYLHAPGGELAALLHRNMKSSNVLLDERLRARVADVGLARPQHGATMTAGVGTFGYVDPGYFATGERSPCAAPLIRPLPSRRRPKLAAASHRKRARRRRGRLRSA
jgi:serine/threonine protein kinase